MDLVDYIRKLAAINGGREYLEERFGPPQVDPTKVALLQKAASAEDKMLLKIAASLATDDNDTLAIYESLGGTYKVAFGTPMFSAPSISPSAPGGGLGGPKPPSPTGGVSMPGAPKPPGQVQSPGQGMGQTPKVKVNVQPQPDGQQGANVSIG